MVLWLSLLRVSCNIGFMKMTNYAENNKANLQAALLALSLDRTGQVPMHAQLAEALRDLIRRGVAPSGAALPASRALAKDLGISRVTTLGAYDQLVAEGYLDTRQGAGTFVAADLPPMETSDTPPDPVTPPIGVQPLVPFHPGLPDTAHFPHAVWAKHLETAWRRPDPDLLAQPDPLGWPPLRAAIADHLNAWRGLSCSAGQVVITSGSVEAFSLLSRLMPEGETVLTEAPCYGPMLQAFRGRGLECRSIPVDAHGLQTDALPAARAVALTPSRNYPLGMTLPLSRRLALLDWAKAQDALVIEDDYDSEFRFSGPPLPALASLSADRVIYVGSFSKLMMPAIRLAYLVVPDRLVAAVTALLQPLGSQASVIPQPALARFMEAGEFATHLRRMRRIYGQRREVLLQALTDHLPDHLIPQDVASGMHLVCDLGPALRGRRDTEVVGIGQSAGLTLRALSRYPEAPEGLQGVVMGYAAFDDAALIDGVRLLAVALGASEQG